MARYRCSICGFIHDEEAEQIPITDVKKCPICHHPSEVYQLLGADGKPIKKQRKEENVLTGEVDSILDEITAELDSDGFMELTVPADSEVSDSTEDLSYPSEFAKFYDDDDRAMEDIHKMAVSGKPILTSMGTKQKLPTWEEIRIMPAQTHPAPLDSSVEVDTATIIGRRAMHPMELESPIIVSHMSFGALSQEAKVSLAKGSAAAKTAIGSGDGGILEQEIEAAYRYIFEYTPDLISVTDDNLRRADAIEIKLGQSARAGMGAFLPAVKVSDEVAAIRGCSAGEDFVGKASFDEITTCDTLGKLVSNLRTRSGGKPIGVKIAAGKIERDLDFILRAEPDFITIDGAEGSCDTVNKGLRDACCIPTIFALARAKRFMETNGVRDVSLIITGGLRTPGDYAKALALGADAVAIGTAAIMSLACHQYRMCETGECPMGVATQNPVLRARLQREAGANRVANYLNAALEQVKRFARMTGNDSVHTLNIRNLCTTSADIAMGTGIEHI